MIWWSSETKWMLTPTTTPTNRADPLSPSLQASKTHVLGLPGFLLHPASLGPLMNCLLYYYISQWSNEVSHMYACLLAVTVLLWKRSGDARSRFSKMSHGAHGRMSFMSHLNLMVTNFNATRSQSNFIKDDNSVLYDTESHIYRISSNIWHPFFGTNNSGHSECPRRRLVPDPPPWPGGDVLGWWRFAPGRSEGLWGEIK